MGELIYKENWQRYLDLGLVPLPIEKETKKPLVTWTELPECWNVYAEWAEKFPDANISVIIGPNWAVVDPDGQEAEKFAQSLDLPLCPISNSSNRSRHRWFKLTKPLQTFSLHIGKNGSKFEVLTGKHLISVPPSIHYKTGKPYRWEEFLAIFDVEAPELPDKVLDLGKKADGRTEGRGSRVNPASILEGVPEGARDDLLFREACRLRSLNLKREEAQILILHAARNAKPPLLDSVALAKLKQAYKYPAGAAKALSTEPAAPALLPFPRESIKGLAKGFADLYSERLESPWEFWAFNFLTLLGHVLADKAGMRTSLKPEPRLYTILLGSSATERKSESIRLSLAFFDRALPGRVRRCFGVGSAEGIQAQLEEDKDDPRMLMIYDELRAFVGKANIEHSTLLEAVSTLFEGNAFSNRTKSSNVKIERSFLSILGACTGETFETMWNANFTNIDFLNRWWVVPAKADKIIAIPEPIPEKEERELRDDLASLVGEYSRFRILDVAPGVNAYYQEWLVNARTNDREYTRRLDTYGLRLMVLLGLQEGKITLSVVEDTVKLLEWQRQARQIYAPIDAKNQVAELEEKFRRKVCTGHQAGRWSIRDLFNATNAFRYSAE